MLKDEAHKWWESVAHAATQETVTWDFFLKEFHSCYVGEQYMEDRCQEFLQLVQGRRSVMQYEIEFRRLSRYAHDINSTDADMCRKFRRGLNNRIQSALLAAETTNLTKLSNMAKVAEQLKVNDEIESPDRGQKRAAEYSHSTSRYTGKRFRDSRGSRHKVPNRFQRQRQNQRLESRPRAQVTLLASTRGSDRYPTCVHCGKHYVGESRRLNGGCYGCVATDHFFRDCPRRQVAPVDSRVRFAPTTQPNQRTG